MELTRSYADVVPQSILYRYDFRETRNAAAVLASTNPPAFGEIMAVLDDFKLQTLDITSPGGSKSRVPTRLDLAFRLKGWREARHDTRIISLLRIMPYRPAGEKVAQERQVEVFNEGYKVDNVKERVALDIEWHAKDGNLDRDVAAYRALYDSAIIDAGVIVTRSFASIRALSIRLGRPGGFATTTTTTLEKLDPRLSRGDGGGCPILAVAITDRCYAP
jgi:hypothetical protein